MKTKYLSESQVRRGIVLAGAISPETPERWAARTLGDGSLPTAPDTVPFRLWMAAHHLGQFVDALGKTIGVGVVTWRKSVCAGITLKLRHHGT